MSQKIVGDRRSLGAQPLDDPVEIDCVPVNNSSRDEAQARRSEALVLEGSVSDFTLAMEEHRPPERVAGLALVEASMTALTQCRV
jgi:hypothetical protein